MTQPVSVAQKDAVQKAVDLAVKYRRQLMVVGGAVVAAVAVGWFLMAAKSRKESFAARGLREAQTAVAAGNAPLAASDLSRLVQTYGGTSAAAEAALLLAQIRMSTGETDQAITELRSFIAGGPDDRFRAPAYGLLGAALEQSGNPRDAADAYVQAAEHWPYEYLKAQALLEAGRNFRTAGDTAAAAETYERIVRDFPDTPSVVEAKLRLGEVRPERVAR